MTRAARKLPPMYAGFGRGRSDRNNVRAARGLPPVTVSAKAVQDHIDLLVSYGMTHQAIAEAAGVSRGTIGGHARREWATTERPYALAVLAVDHRPHPAQRQVLPFAARRRFRALQWMGYSMSDLAARLGFPARTRVDEMLDRQMISPDLARALADLYKELSLVPGPSKRAATWARKHGFHGPWAWDDETIDEPFARPIPYARDGFAIEDVRHLRSTRGGALSYEEIAERLGTSVHEIAREVRRLGPAILTDDEAAAADTRWQAGETLNAIAADLGVHRKTLSNAILRARAAHTPEDANQPEGETA